MPVEVAVTPEQHRQGLSDRESLSAGTGMLFVFESPRSLRFWMVRMQFPLDFVWIGDDCTVADITPDVPAPEPGTPESELMLYRPSAPILYNLEVNADTAAPYGIRVGDAVRFRNVPGGGC